jgi:hypothetical protein
MLTTVVHISPSLLFERLDKETDPTASVLAGWPGTGPSVALGRPCRVEERPFITSSSMLLVGAERVCGKAAAVQRSHELPTM